MAGHGDGHNAGCGSDTFPFHDTENASDEQTDDKKLRPEATT